MANNDELYSLMDSSDGSGERPEEDRPTGTVFINNTSYSGADIKLVVHVYDTGAGKKDMIREIKANEIVEESRRLEVESEISTVENSLGSVHSGTNEEHLLQKKLSRLRAEWTNLCSSLSSAQFRKDSLAKSDTSLSTLVLADVQTISISTHRDKRAVRALGKVYPVGFSRGQREIAGSMVFTVFNEATLYRILEAHPSDFDSVAYTTALLDQLPPMDITIAFANEYGQTSRMGIFGVEFLTEGTTMSIEDIMTENVCNYVARDFDPMRKVAQRKIDEGSRLVSAWAGQKASDLILEDEYQNEKTMNDPYERFRRRSNPFL
jgi:hypothetical protein